MVVGRDAALKILRRVPDNNGFFFFRDIGQYIGVYAVSLADFCQKLKTVDLKSVEFHSKRGDFDKWIETTVGDAYLAEEIRKLERTLNGEELRRAICMTVEARVNELKRLLASEEASIKRM
ncbi:MAG: DUF5752 family protein [Nitrososphaerota archaeon]|nr:DUF5752 family protein [Candidatus Bathyarchaeota archaeon]MDW8023540.1 DUF5752 family protein [Nitrososphaerota archaeon]